jgi:hypothetical protein
MTHPHRKHELAECLRRTPRHGTIHDSLCNAFSLGLSAPIADLMSKVYGR